MTKFDQSKLKTVPHQPGVYFWLDKNNNIIYIGKAKNLQKRMIQYFKGSLNSYMTNALVERITDFKYTITKDEKDALILENNMIKKHNPKYNILLLDDKGYLYLRIQKLTNDLQIKIVNHVKDDKGVYFGPFPPRHSVKNIYKLLIRLTRFKDGLPIKNTPSEHWDEMYSLCKKILSPNNSSIRKELYKKMIEAANIQSFELANDYKQIIDALEFYAPSSAADLGRNINEDVWGIEIWKNFISIYLMFYRDGQLLSVMDQIVDSNNIISIENYIEKFYMQNIIPNEIIIDKKYAENLFLDSKIIFPQKGINLKVLKIATKNAKDNIDQKIVGFLEERKNIEGAVSELGALLNIKNLHHIIMIDNSVTGTDEPVTGLVSYRNGMKQKSEYRKYNLELNERHADVDYMHQAIDRYLENEGNKIPDLLIVDGGKPQVSEVRKAIEKHNKKINVIGLVKDDKHQTRAIIDITGKEIQINSNSLLRFLATIQIEVDRFAKQHHTSRRKINTLQGKLRTIPGIGEKLEIKLLNHFKTYSNIYNASIDDLSKVVPTNIAKKIKELL